jgi:hypothetical protein
VDIVIKLRNVSELTLLGCVKTVIKPNLVSSFIINVWLEYTFLIANDYLLPWFYYAVIKLLLKAVVYSSDKTCSMSCLFTVCYTSKFNAHLVVIIIFVIFKSMYKVIYNFCNIWIYLVNQFSGWYIIFVIFESI